MSLTVKIDGDSTGLKDAIRKSKEDLSSLSNFAKSSGASFVGNFSANLASSLISSIQSAVAQGIDMGVNFTIDASKAASETESLTSQFETLLKSKSAATNRMEEITEFAAKTPYEIQELAKTSKLLQTLGGTLLATGSGLRMVGDAAAVAGEPIGEVGLHIGRIFGAVTSGTSAGESVGRLQELGLISGEVRRKFEALAESQKKGERVVLSQAEALKLLQGVLKDSEGAMERLASTTEGKLSNLTDNISQLKVAFGVGFNDGLKVALDATNNFLPTLQEKFKAAGEILGDGIEAAVNGNLSRLANIGALIGTALVEGLKAVYLKGMDELIAAAQNQISDPIGVVAVGDRVARAAGVEPPLTREKTEAASMVSYIQTAMENVSQSPAMRAIEAQQLESAIKRGIELGIDETMPTAVREGVLAAWKRQTERPAARFSN